MLGGSIGGIPLMWILMAQSAANRRRKRTMAKAKELALGDFIIDPESKQWCRVLKSEYIEKKIEVNRSFGSGSSEHSQKRELALQEKYKLNIPVRGSREKYDGDLERFSVGEYNHTRMSESDWATRRLTLQFADKKILERLAGPKTDFTCIRAPEIFSFNFDQLADLATNTQRESDEVAKKKSAKKKSAKKKSAKKKVTA